MKTEINELVEKEFKVLIPEDKERLFDEILKDYPHFLVDKCNKTSQLIGSFISETITIELTSTKISQNDK